MEYRKFRADQLFDGNRLYKNEKILITDSTGKIIDLVNAMDVEEVEPAESGILSPGFVNCHCHLELSHLKNVIPPHTGLIDFLCMVVSKRNFDSKIIKQAIENAEKEIFENGTVAVGDISNTADTAFIKNKSKIRWQNFVEVLNFTDDKLEENLSNYKNVANQLIVDNPTTLVPHAPYSISPKTFQLLNQLSKNQIISIHNQENPAEDELFKTGGGAYLKLFQLFGMEKSPFPITNKSSVRSYLPYFNNGQTVLLIHNTFMSEEDIVWANNYASSNQIKLVYCFCINANLYIENKTPKLENFIKHNCNIVLGTDSYSSNWQLNIAKEIQTVRKQFPSIPLETILQWSTKNGANALAMENKFGCFEKGTTPGVVLIANDFSSSKRLI